jgi:hypothetical protein
VPTILDMMLVVHAAQSSTTLELVRQGILATKTLYTLDDPANAELLSVSAVAVRPGDLWRPSPY